MTVTGPNDPLLLDGRYRLGRVLGRGGMADVREGVDERLHRQVAVKLLRASGGEPERFAGEIRTLAQLEHPNIVRLLDAGTAPDDRPYLVMELVDGVTLATRLADGPLPGEELRSVAAGVAAGLAYVHARGIVHRDVKPGNILLGPDDRVRLADFGVARLVDTGGLTVTGLVIGTPAYLAPEQVAGGPVGPPADLYAFGLVLAECLTGRRVFAGTPSEAAAARFHPAPLALGGVPPAWRALLAAMTAVDPADRPEAADLPSAILALPGAATGGGPPSPGGAGEPATFVTPRQDPGGTTRRLPPTEALATGRAPERPGREGPDRDGPTDRPRRGRRPLLGAAVLLVALLLGLGLDHLLTTPTTPPARAADGHDPGKAGGTLVTSPEGSTSSSTTSTSTTSSTTSTSTTTTSTSTTTTTTQPPVSPEAAAQSLAAVVSAGEQAGTVSGEASAQLYGALQELDRGGGGSGAVAEGIDRLGGVYDSEVTAGQVTGSSVAAIGAAIDSLAAALGVPDPPGLSGPGSGTPGPGTTTTTTATTLPAGPGDFPGPGGSGYHHHQLAP